ncbi:MAG: glycosyltransferase [Bacteroidaceae bacterium]|nr:glycosyltransferase [Bacteroidaceae bacterium]
MATPFPKITVVTPSYNQAKFLERTILSIINQDYPNLEYIVCDGGSTDGSVEIIKRYADKIDWWCSERDNGQTDAINKGMHHATGEIVGWINSDDILLPGALHELARLATEHKDSDVFMGHVVRFDDKDRIISFNIVPPPLPAFYRHGIFYFSQQGWWWRRRIFDEIGYLNIERNACMDMEFFLRQLRAGYKISYTGKHLGAIRIYEGTKTSTDGDNAADNIWARDRKFLREEYADFHYQNESKLRRILYRLLKTVNGMYLKQWWLEHKYRGKDISTFKY